MASKYYIIVNENDKGFLDLCGHYTLVDNKEDASRWDDVNHKVMWFYLHELEATTNYRWYVKAHHSGEVIEEPEEARTFYLSKNNSIENTQYLATLEKETFNKAFEGNKPEVDEDYFTGLFINGKFKYIPVAKVNGKYYRYKHSLREPSTSLRYWKW